MSDEDNKQLQSLNNLNSADLVSNHSMKHSLCGSLRLLIAFLTFWGLCMMASMRMSTSMAIVCMINHTAIYNSLGEINTQNGSKKCDEREQFPNDNMTNTFLIKVHDGEFEWDKEIQGYIHASLFWGYVITQLPGALMGHKFGGRIVTGVSLFISAICAILCPVAARIHFMLLIALRFVSGLAMGTTVSQLYKLFSKWSPPNERSVLIGLSISGLIFGNSFSLGVSAFFCQYGGWELIFYVFGGVTLLWFVIWMLVVTDDPQHNRFIRQKELKYIVCSSMENNKKKTEIPWSQILTSKPVWSAFSVHVSINWFAYVFETNLPTFLNDQVGISQFWNGVISVTGYFTYWLGIILSSLLADAMITSKKFSIVFIRKIFTTLGVLLPCTLSLILAMVPSTCDNRIIQMLLAYGCVAFSCFRTAGYSTNFADLAPEFSGIIFSMSNTLATIPGFVAPIFIGYVTKNNLASEWSFVFYVTAGLTIVGWFIYMIWGSGSVQSWAINESELTVTLNEEEKV